MHNNSERLQTFLSAAQPTVLLAPPVKQVIYISGTCTVHRLLLTWHVLKYWQRRWECKHNTVSVGLTGLYLSVKTHCMSGGPTFNDLNHLELSHCSLVYLIRTKGKKVYIVACQLTWWFDSFGNCHPAFSGHCGDITYLLTEVVAVLLQMLLSIMYLDGHTSDTPLHSLSCL